MFKLITEQERTKAPSKVEKKSIGDGKQEGFHGGDMFRLSWETVSGVWTGEHGGRGRLGYGQ